MSDRDSGQSFTERVEEVRQQRAADGERGDLGRFHEEISKETQWGIVVAAFLGGGVLGAVANPTQPGSGFFTVGFLCGGVAWAFATESGTVFREEFVENVNENQQQQQATPSKPKVVCASCGWQNPKGNNYCHDCGERLGD